MPATPSRTLPIPPWLRAVLVVAVVLAVIWLRVWINANRDDTLDGELVRTVEHRGHTYALFFHPGVRYFNTIRRDGELVFDSRSDPRTRECIHELLEVEGMLHRRCYRSLEKEIVMEPLP